MCKCYTYDEHTKFNNDNAAVQWEVFTTDTLVLFPLETFKEWRNGGFKWQGVYTECDESRSAFVSEVTWGCNLHKFISFLQYVRKLKCVLNNAATLWIWHYWTEANDMTYLFWRRKAWGRLIHYIHSGHTSWWLRSLRINSKKSLAVSVMF
jgi:hypothetical protein